MGTHRKVGHQRSMIHVGKTHLGEVDYLRVIGLISIVVIHAFGFYLSMPVSGQGARIFQELTVDLLRFGRYVFIFVTGVVLFYGYSGRKINLASFFNRRLKNIVIPYAVWTAIYLLIKYWAKMINWPNTAGFIATWAQNLLNGNGYSHLYYIIVSIQFYLFFPLLLVLFKPRRPRLAAGIILTGGLLLYGIYYFLLEAHASSVTAMVGGAPGAGILAWFMQYKDRILISYLPFYLLGGLVGMHLDAWRKWLQEHDILITAGMILSGGLVIGEYFYLYRHMGESWAMTVSVFNPSMYFYSLVIIVVLFRLAMVWERRKTMRSLVSLLAANSLGIYLVHPAVLYVVHSYLWPYQYLPGSLLVILDLAVTIAASCLISHLLGRSRYTRFMIGEAGNLSRRQPAVNGAPTAPKLNLRPQEHFPQVQTTTR
ncbi:MAG TPA: acyltransferase [Spirochaetia bacterium]|nr:acyltransferase [Spirochaetia bacterium]